MKYIIMCFALTGCTALQTTEMFAANVVTDYCKAPELGRNLIRSEIAEALKPNSIQINCGK